MAGPSTPPRGARSPAQCFSAPQLWAGEEQGVGWLVLEFPGARPGRPERLCPGWIVCLSRSLSGTVLEVP